MTKIQILKSQKQFSIMKIILFVLSIIGYSYSWFPKIVWTYWHDPIQQAPHLIKAFHANHIQFTQGWQLRHLDKNNMWKWLGQIPKFKQRMESQVWKNEGKAKISDMIRMALVNHYGGLYFDKTIILTRNLDWVLELKDKKLYLPNDASYEPDVFIHYAGHSNGPKISDEKTQNNVPIMPNFQSFFLAGKPGNKFLTQWLEKVFEQKIQSYKLYGNDKSKSWLIQKAFSQSTPITLGTDNSYFEVIISGGNMVSNKQHELQKIFNIKQDTQPLALKYYKLMLMNAQDSGYRYLVSQYLPEKYLNRVSLQELKQKNVYPYYYVKMLKPVYKGFNTLTILPNFLCLNSWYILEDSVTNQFLLKYYKHKYYFRDVVKSQEEFNRYFCPVTVFMAVFIIATITQIVFRVRNWRKQRAKIVIETGNKEFEAVPVLQKSNDGN